jgi:hypothetical protein
MAISEDEYLKEKKILKKVVNLLDDTLDSLGLHGFRQKRF